MPASLQPTLTLNQEILQHRWPSLLAGLTGRACPHHIYPSNTPEPTLIVDGIHLTSGYDRAGEAALQALLVPPGSPEAWVYGPALGDLPRALLARSDLRRLHVILLNRDIFYNTLQWFDQSDWLADPRTALALCGEEDAVRLPFAASPACLRLAENQAARLRDQVVLELAAPFINHRFEETALLAARLEQNAALLDGCGDVRQVFGARPGGSVVVAAAGPTLADHYPFLLSHRSEYTLIAVDAALRPLARAGLVPDLAVSIDEKPVVFDFFQFDLRGWDQAGLVFFPGIDGRILQAWPGPRLAAYPQGSRRYLDLARRRPRAELFASGSVSHPAADLAVKLGARRLLLAGFDYGYPAGLSHAPGSPAARPVQDSGAAGAWVLNGLGERIPTRPDLRGFLRDLERYISAHPTIDWINLSRQGAQIAGTRYPPGDPWND